MKNFTNDFYAKTSDYSAPTDDEQRWESEAEQEAEQKAQHDYDMALESPVAVESVDRDAMAKSQLEALGYVKGDKVFLRFFFPNRSGGGRNADFIYPNIPWTLIDQLQNEGRGCYFVVNGQGQKDENVLKGKAVFYEHDNLSRELQLDLWKTLELPEPTIQINTGGKSIHSYWVFDQPIEIADWEILQTDLLDFSDGDRQIKNASRVMRLAGAIHISKTGIKNQTMVISNSGTRHDFDELRSIVPSQDMLKDVPNVVTDTSTRSKAPKALRVATDTVSKAVEVSNSSIPSLLDIKAALVYVDPDCSHDDWCSIGMALHSQDINLLSEWKSWSSGSEEKPSEKYKGECDYKWSTFKASKAINIYKLFQIAKDQGTGYQAPKAIETKIQQIKEAANSVKSFTPRPTDLALEINELESEDLCNSVSEHQATVDGAWDLVKSSVPQELVTAFESTAKSTGVPEMANLVTVLAATSAAVNASYVVNVPRSDEPWLEHLNLMVALVGEPGGLKSNIYTTAVKPFQTAQMSYNMTFKDEVITYKQLLANFKIQSKEQTDIPEPEEPTQRTCNFGIGTMEALVANICVAAVTYNSGVFWNVDELDTAFGGFNKYNGADDDIKIFLSMFNGGYVGKDTLKSKLSSDRTPVSMLGGIQESMWLLISKKMSKSDKNSDGNGFTGRFLLGLIPKEAERNIIFGDPKYVVNPVTIFVEKFRNTHLDRPGITDIHLEKAAIPFCGEIEAWAKKGVKSTGMKNHYSKGISYTYRVAGMFALWNKRTVINLDDLKAARAVVDYSIAVDRVIHHNNDTSTAVAVVSKAYELGKKKGKLTTRLLNDAKLGTIHDRQAIITGVSDLYGGHLTKNNRGSLTWVP